MVLFSGLKVEEVSRTKDILKDRFNNFVLELKVRNYSRQTINAYLYHIDKFLQFTKKEQRSVSTYDIRTYLNNLIMNGAGPRTINLAISSLKCYFESYLGKRLFDRIKRAKVPNDITPVLPREQIFAMINSTKFLKHKLLIELLYSSGMRVGECVKLKVGDIDGNVIFIKKGKGNKDRFVITSQYFLRDLRRYIETREKESIYLFDNLSGGHITIRTAEEIVRSAARRAGIVGRVYPHLLRACFATHLLEEELPLESIQKLMGHADIKTTQGYTRLKTDYLKVIKSPLD
ncbi:MAG: site-specific tyrosine recombinase/integron integrase [Nanoarchaeota archaeon]|nr:site-specific tyrosine recombinase/integron integrase [Nanoarchaeota archaeon]